MINKTEPIDNAQDLEAKGSDTFSVAAPMPSLASLRSVIGKRRYSYAQRQWLRRFGPWKRSSTGRSVSFLDESNEWSSAN